jgi:hypothetical protein
MLATARSRLARLDLQLRLNWPFGALQVALILNAPGVRRPSLAVEGAAGWTASWSGRLFFRDGPATTVRPRGPHGGIGDVDGARLGYTYRRPAGLPSEA